MKIKLLFSLLFLVSALIFPSISILAQGDPGGDPDVKVPFDGGLSLLIAAGIGYGIKKAHDKRKSDRAFKNTDKHDIEA